jgi:HK97 family phage major capsid protein
MTLQELRDRRAKAIADAQAIISADVTTESRAAFDAHLNDVTTIDADIARVEAIERVSAEQRSRFEQQRSNRPNPGESADAGEAVEVRNLRTRASFRAYLATGVIESRDLTTANSGVAIPQLFDPQIISAQKSYGQLLDIVNVMTTDTGNPMKIMLDNDTANGLSAVTVGTDAAEVDPVLTGITLQVDNFTTGVVKVDMGLLTDVGFDIDAWIRDKFAKRYFRGASALILAGNGGSVGSLATAYASGFTGAIVAKMTYADFAMAVATLDPAYQQDAIWAVNNSALGAIIGLVDSNARPLFLPYNDGGTAGFVGTLLGKPVKLVTQMPNVATGSVSAYYGSFKDGYTFRVQKPGLGILRLNERYAAGFEVGFVGFVRCGGVATNAGVPPIIGITTK